MGSGTSSTAQRSELSPFFPVRSQAAASFGKLRLKYFFCSLQFLEAVSRFFPRLHTFADVLFEILRHCQNMFFPLVAFCRVGVPSGSHVTCQSPCFVKGFRLFHPFYFVPSCAWVARSPRFFGTLAVSVCALVLKPPPCFCHLPGLSTRKRSSSACLSLTT